MLPGRTTSTQDEVRPNAMLNHVLGPQRPWMQSQGDAITHEQQIRSAALLPPPSTASSSNPRSLSMAADASLSTQLPTADSINSRQLPSPATIPSNATQQQIFQPNVAFSYPQTITSSAYVNPPSTVPYQGWPQSGSHTNSQHIAHPLNAHVPSSSSPIPAVSTNAQRAVLQNNHTNVLQPQQPTNHRLRSELHSANYTPMVSAPNGEHAAPSGRGNTQPQPAISQATVPGMTSNPNTTFRERILHPPLGFDGRTRIPWGPGRLLIQAHLSPGFISEVPNVHWLPFVKELAIFPKCLEEVYLLQTNISITESEYSQLLQLTDISDGARCYVKQDRTSALQFFLNCVKGSEGTAVNEEKWLQSPTAWPPTLSITVNGQLVELSRRFHWQADLPADITTKLRAGLNDVRVSIMNLKSGEDTHFFAVERMEWSTLDNVRSQVLVQQEPRDTTIDRLQALFASSDPDVEILTDYITINVRDPLSSAPINVPVRSKTCEHMECFDLDTYLNSRPNAKVQHSTSWQCPICRSDARPQNLLAIPWMQNMLVSVGQKALKAQAILIHQDGKLTVKPEETIGQRADSELPVANDRARSDTANSARMVIELD